MRKRLKDHEAIALGFTPKQKKGHGNPKYSLDLNQLEQLQAIKLELKKVTKNSKGETISKNYGKKQTKQKFDTSKFTPVSYTTNPFGEGVWAKYDLPKEDRLKALKEAIYALKEDITPTKSVKLKSKDLDSNICNQYTLTDYHLGMMAWDEETGDNWDLKIAEETLTRFFELAIKESPKAENAIFAQIGDFLHWDGLDAVTPANKHVLDADTRFTKLVRVAIKVIRRVIKMLLQKYKHVHLIMAEGNHDPASSSWLREMLHAFYEDETRLTIDTNPDPYYCYTFGECCLFYHHGHKKNIKNIDSTFVGKFKKEFGVSKYVYAHTGHLHHELKIESNLMVLEQHRTLASKDAYASRGGYLSGRDAKVITYHKDFGEVDRKTININRLK